MSRNLTYLVHNRDIPLGFVVVSLPGCAAVGRVVVMHMQIAWQPDATGTGGGASEKRARTVLAAFICTMQVFVPRQAPCQPSKTEPRAGTAIKLTVSPPR